MTKIIVFAWNSNTWKTTAIHYLKERYGKLHPDIRIELMNETAREYIDAHWWWLVEDVHAMQVFIAGLEKKRIERMKEIKEKNLADLVFVDRTAMDCMVYTYWNLVNNNLNRVDFFDDYHKVLCDSRDVYDKIVFFTTPIKIDNRFPIYNNEHINKVFEHTFKYFYGDKVITYTNNIFFQDNIESTIFGNLFDM